MNRVYGYLCNPYNGNGLSFPPCALTSANVKLDDSLVWDIGIDQSSSCTGLCFMSTNEKLLGMLDIKHDRSCTKNQFYRELKGFLVRLVSGKKIRLVVYERPVPSKKARYASEVLRELKGRMDEWTRDIPEFQSAAVVDSLYPQTWKSLVVDKSKGKNRSSVKAEVASDLADRYPSITTYFNTYSGKSYDSFDSLGILTGYKLYAYYDGEIEKIHGYKEKSHISFVIYFQAPKGMPLPDAVKKQFGVWAGADTIKGLRFLAYNLAYNWIDNVRMASSNNDGIITLLPESEVMSLKWKYGFKSAEDGYNTYAVIFRKGSLTPREVKLFRDSYTSCEEIVGE